MGGALFETHVLAEVIKRFRHRAREVDVYFWRTRDGQEIDFLIESDGRTWPVEVKIGSPLYDRLRSLRRIAEPSWQAGQVVSLAAPADPVRIADDWTLCAPRGLDLGIAAGSPGSRETHG
jgi:predicted AAA+ superfamily ATPase